MRNATERRQFILEILSDRRFETIDNLANEYNVSRSTIKRDIEIISLSAPIYTSKGTGGGVYVADGYYISKRYLRPEQEALLLELSNNLQGEEQKIMNTILLTFAKPKVKEKDNSIEVLFRCKQNTEI